MNVVNYFIELYINKVNRFNDLLLNCKYVEVVEIFKFYYLF